VIETNLRASRTFPFISKVTSINFMELFVDALFAQDIPEIEIPPIPFTAIKAPQFSFSRLTNADPVLSVEMSSTGEVACFGEDVEEAYLKTKLAAGESIPRKGIFLSLCGEEKHAALEQSLPHLQKLAIPLYATSETWQFLHEHDITATLVHNPNEDGQPNVQDLFANQQIDLAVVIVAGRLQKDFDEYYQMRRLAIDCNIQLITKIKQLRLFLNALVSKNLDTLPIKAWDEYRIMSKEEDAISITEEEPLVSTQV
jgi:hypothetical protein